METAYFRFATKKDSSSAHSYTNGMSSIFLTSMLFSGSIYLFAGSIAEILGYPDKKNVIEWIAIILATDAIVAIPFAKLRLLNRVYLFAGAKISSIILNIFFNIFFLIVCPNVMNDGFFPSLKPLIESFYDPKLGIGYIFAANLMSNLAYFPFLIPSFRGLKLKIDFVALKAMFIYGFPILIMGIAGTVNDMFSRIMLKELLPVNFYPGKTSLAALGIFGACYKLAVFMILAVQAFRYASEPFFFSNSHDKNAPALFGRVMKYFVIVTVSIFLFVSINVDWLANILQITDVYKEGLIIVPVLLMANLFMGIYFNLSVWYKLTDKTYWGTYITIGGALITVAANYFLIPKIGYMGSVWATFSAYFLMSAASYFIGQKYYPVPYPLISIGFYILLGVGLYQISLILAADGINGLLYDNLLILGYIFIVFIKEAFIVRRINPIKI